MDIMAAIIFSAVGKTIGRTHAHHTFNVEAPVKKPEATLIYAQEAERAEAPSVFGVKGRSAFFEIVEISSLEATVDYMQCVLLGVFPEFLNCLLQLLTPSVWEQMSKTVLTLNCPNEMVVYARKIRALDELPQFNPNEFFNRLFYISQIVFQCRVDFLSHKVIKPHEISKIYKRLSLNICSVL